MNQLRRGEIQGDMRDMKDMVEIWLIRSEKHTYMYGGRSNAHPPPGALHSAPGALHSAPGALPLAPELALARIPTYHVRPI